MQKNLSKNGEPERCRWEHRRSRLSALYHLFFSQLGWLCGKVFAVRAAELGLTPAFTVNIFQAVIPVTKKIGA